MNTRFRSLALAAIFVLFFACHAVPKGSDSESSSGIRSGDISRAIAKLMESGVPLQKDPKGSVRWIEAKKGELKDEYMSLLPLLPDLEWLEIGGGDVTEKGINHLRKCTALKRLYVHDIELKEAELTWISNLRHLEALSLQRTGIKGKFLEHLNSIDSLKVLNLSENPVTDADMALIARFKNLEVLALADTQITGTGIGLLKGMPRLNELNIQNCGIYDNDLLHFLSMPNLRIVYAEGCNISDVAIAGMMTRFPSLAIFR
ncbi:MAG: hypothetical protein JW944_12630 [Deltaproteobacteria bacterium]|nr:hypothetical protein [Deltaproteobacteria bacterium]